MPTANTSGKLDVLGHDSDAPGMNGAQVGVLEKADNVSSRSLLECKNGMALEPQIRLILLSNLVYEALEWLLSDQQLCALLFAASLFLGAFPPVDFLAVCFVGAISNSAICSRGDEGRCIGSWTKYEDIWATARYLGGQGTDFLKLPNRVS
ncbi:hypothetical protein Ancab_008983 [Ancistrocladus abbreviatus]